MKNLFKALSAFQQEVPVIHKSTEGYGYSYAPLSEILGTINPLMKKHGLGFYQAVNGTQLMTCIFHIEAGESIVSNTDIPQGVQLAKMNDFQVLGSAITYIRRYALSSMLGLVTDKDTDAAGEQTKGKAPASKADDGKPWLNEGSPEFSKVYKAMKEGYTIEQIRKKYKVSKKCEELLNM